MSVLAGLRVELNRRLMLGMETIQAHYALYPSGASYVRHRDRFRNDDARVLSLVCYLNPDWPEDAGGALRLHLADGAIDIAPRMGTTVLFLSEEIEHEVLPATQPRWSIAAWFLRSAHS
jgi:SM-20-related protein